MQVRPANLSSNVSRSDLISTAADAAGALILNSILGLWFTCAEDEGDDARSVRACADMNEVQSVQIDHGNSSTCAISLLSALDSFGDVSIETATSTAQVLLKNPYEARGFVVDLQNKLELLTNLDGLSRRSAVIKKNAPVKDSFMQEDYSVDIDDGDDDIPVDGGLDESSTPPVAPRNEVVFDDFVLFDLNPFVLYILLTLHTLAAQANISRF